MSHTPGPWIWDEDEAHLTNPLLLQQWIDRKYPDNEWPYVLLAEWHNDSTAGIYAKNPADKTLIAAAPDLMATLRVIQNMSGDPIVEAMCESAIAKAEGRS